MSDLLAAFGPEVWRRVLGAGEPGGAMVRSAKAGYCGKCKAHALFGLDDDSCAFGVTVDPEPLSAVGEVMAHLSNLRTFELRRAGDGYQLDRRLDSYIARRPAGAGIIDVLAAHLCGGPTLERAAPILGLRKVEPHREPPF